MKIENDSEGRFLFRTENLQEENSVKALRAEVIDILPRLQELWEKDLIVLSKLSDLSELKGKYVFPSKKFSIFDTGTPIAIRVKRAYGRSMDKRTLLATMRLLLGAPIEKVLAQEKEWRLEEYYQKLRDKSVERELKKARKNAIRNADMCLKRACDSVEEFFNQNPELLLQYSILQAVVRERIGTDTGKSLLPKTAIG